VTGLGAFTKTLFPEEQTNKKELTKIQGCKNIQKEWSKLPRKGELKNLKSDKSLWVRPIMKYTAPAAVLFPVTFIARSQFQRKTPASFSNVLDD
jgi:hypothetical protein